nr:hypothetical protein [uncultured Cupriavidus sp.]
MNASIVSCNSKGCYFDTSANGYANAYFLRTGESTMLGVAL